MNAQAQSHSCGRLQADTTVILSKQKNQGKRNIRLF